MLMTPWSDHDHTFISTDGLLMLMPGYVTLFLRAKSYWAVPEPPALRASHRKWKELIIIGSKNVIIWTNFDLVPHTYVAI